MVLSNSVRGKWFKAAESCVLSSSWTSWQHHSTCSNLYMCSSELWGVIAPALPWENNHMEMHTSWSHFTPELLITSYNLVSGVLVKVCQVFRKKKTPQKPWFVAFANFHGVNTPTMADFKLPIWSNKNIELGRDGHDQLSWASVSQLQNTTMHNCLWTREPREGVYTHDIPSPSADSLLD